MFLIQKIIEIKKITFIFDKSIKKTLIHERMIKNKIKQWFAIIRFIVIENYIVYKKFDFQIVEIFDELKSYLNNIDYQKNDCFKTCQRLNISYNEIDDTIFRIENMIINRKLYYWQFIAIKWILNMIKHFHFQKCIFANYMNVEKIFEILNYLLTINNFHLFVNVCLLMFVC